MKGRRNPFVVLEAINAAGKTTQFKLLKTALVKAGYTTHPYHFHQRQQATGQLIEHKFLHAKASRGRFSRREQALLYIQDFYTRAEEIEQLRQSIKAKNYILADRYYSSTLAYQTMGLAGKERQEMIAWIKWLCEEGRPHLPKPDQIMLLDTPVEVAAKHLIGTSKDFFENTKKLTALRRSYLRLAKEENWTIIDSVNDKGQQRPPQDIHQEILAKLKLE